MRFPSIFELSDQSFYFNNAKEQFDSLSWMYPHRGSHSEVTAAKVLFAHYLLLTNFAYQKVQPLPNMPVLDTMPRVVQHML